MIEGSHKTKNNLKQEDFKRLIQVETSFWDKYQNTFNIMHKICLHKM